MTIRWTGTATALTSIAHSAESLGTINYLRREKFLLPNGEFEDVPTVSGNALRGLLRDAAADLWWESVGKPKLTLPVVHALWSGGALAKVSGPLLTGARLATLKKVCPVVGVFGTAGGGKIISGALQVGKLIPQCRETAHLFELDPITMPSHWDLTQIEYYSRFPNEIDVEQDTSSNDESQSNLARYGVETIIAGTVFSSWIALSWASKAEEAFFQEVLARFTAKARVGGLARIGHGELKLDLTPSRDPEIIDWRADSQVAVKDLLEALSWLD